MLQSVQLLHQNKHNIITEKLFWSVLTKEQVHTAKGSKRVQLETIRSPLYRIGS